MNLPDYRPDIDGLRAVAVLAVILFHAGVPALGGGYVGVDVFFVISGYLITGILLRSLQAGRHTIAGFYERRIRRIFPALFVVIAASAVAACALLLADELSNFGHSVLATSLFFANYHFMADTGYFAAPAATKPLLHMWSLAVEEQFYVVFPLLVAAVWKLARRHLLSVVITLALASLAYALWLMRHSPDQAFYSAPARAWELLAGAVVAIAMHQGLRPAGAALATPLAALALLGVLAPIVLYTEATPFPGLAALAPVLGTACLIYAMATPGNPVARLLACQPMRFVGLISYSLYLWHWPIFVFYKAWRVAPVGALESALLVAATFAAAIASWRWVERPFRGHAAGPTPATPQRRVLGTGLTTMALSAAVGGALLLSKGWPQRFEPEVGLILQAGLDEPRLPLCAVEPDDAGPTRGRCTLGTPGVAQSFALWGDSHAEALAPAVEAAALQAGVGGVISVRGGCPPLVGVRQMREGFRDCADRAERFLRELAGMPEVKTVLIAARWSLYAEGVRFRGEAGHVVYIADEPAATPSLAGNAQVFERGLRRTVQRLRAMGRTVVFVTQVPEAEYHVPRAMARLHHLGRTDAGPDLAPLRTHYEARRAIVERQLRTFEPALDVVRVENMLCPGGRCTVAREGLPIYRDSNHLTGTHARSLAPLFAAALSPSR
jgi:peptidoglycan/LPS O-acetylase OafA/YrhL